MSNTLAAKVKAVNRVNKALLEVFPVLSNFFKDYVGKQVVKADGDFLKKVAASMPQYPYNGPVQVIRYSSGNSLAFTVKVSENIAGAGSCLYQERTVYIGELEGGVLVSLCKPPQGYRTDYTLEDIQELRRIHQKAKEAASDALSALHRFGEYD